ncbi:MAG: helicase RepA family protein [Desulfovibrionaceae bacterium]|nr:helicase RepA family protein [Desulfovibrionaceae bacterium]
MNIAYDISTIQAMMDSRVDEVEAYVNQAAGMLTNAFTYKVYSGTDILTLPRLLWRVKGVLPETGLAAIYGFTRTGKSFLALDLSLAIALGSDWFGWKTIPCPVLYVYLESSWGLQLRLKAWMQETRNAPPPNLSFIIDAFDLQNEEHRQAIIQAAPKNGVLIIDTLNRATPGSDENSSRDMGNIIKAAAEIQAEIGGLVLFVTHSGKDTSRGIRGHTSFIAALDAAIEVDRKGDNRFLKLDKVKEGLDGLTHDFRLKPVVIGYRPDGSEITSCVVEPVIRLGQEKTLSPALKYALDSFDKACAAEGKDDVHLNAWRPVFYAGHTADKQDTKLKSFNRGRKELVELGILAVNNDLYTRTDRTCPGQAGQSSPATNPDGPGHTPLGVSGKSGWLDELKGDPKFSDDQKISDLEVPNEYPQSSSCRGI